MGNVVRTAAKFLAVGLAISTLTVGVTPARADDASDAKALVEQARLTLEKFAGASAMGGFRDLIKKARGVFIAPSVLRGAFVFGVSGGSGVLLGREAIPGKWGGPAFYSFGEASFGLQAGADASQVVLLAMTERGLTKLLSPSTKLGVDASVAAGPVGAGASAETAGLSADILSFTLNKGAYVGVSAEGAVVGTRGSLNQAYYGKEVSPTDIVIRHTVSSPNSSGLIAQLTKLAGGS